MKYKSNNLIIENKKIKSLAQTFKTPLYCYSYENIKNNINNFQKHFKKINPLICFSVKSNPNKILLNEIGKLGVGADVVSIGELMRSLKSGIKPNKIVFSGVGKTRKEIEYAIEKKILLINAESKSEIINIEKIAKSKNKKVNIGIRLNPNTDPKTLDQISTGKKDDKFGVPEKIFLDLIKYVNNSKSLNLKCLSVHIGSQILNHRPYEKMIRVIEKVLKKSNFQFEYIDLGGGMGINYDNQKIKLNLKKYSKIVEKFVKKYRSKIIFEPGRSIIGNAGILISKVIYIKQGFKKDFVILDAAMNNLMRPALYGAKHQILPVKKRNSKSKKMYEFVGPICESTDKFSSIKNFQKLNEDDLVIICDVGAYGTSLSSNYNLRPNAAEILIKKSNIKLIKKRQLLKDII